MKFTVRAWRQESQGRPGHFETHEVADVTPEMSFLEMLDKLNEDLIKNGSEPFAFDSDCREGICGTCSLMVNGRAHGHQHGCTVCEIRMRTFKDGEVLTVEPFRARPFPVVRDLIADRSAFDRIIQAGGYVSVGAGSVPDAASTPISKADADRAMDAAQCIGCGACVAQCPNGAAMLFTGAKLAHLFSLPQGRVEWKDRVLSMVGVMDAAGFGNCSNHGECQAACPKDLKLNYIAQMNRQFLFSALSIRRVKGVLEKP